ncbi:ABC transporter ATP-binding protein [Bacillus horti]|uniref:Peptide/nickel transport system ATP-binding protein n=1 Tax=Caldalkalibacillus horti TaxID=77523 RepID=A0ABT9VWJ4_9BACI|nr:ABC transporter ATP-binding protein [Bacillus horti]MDQ0165368.1 peptide/nickel transport system ATP-binding protein [Bacillus horti]
MNNLLHIQNLKTSFRIGDHYYAAVDDVSLDINKNEIIAIVGESGCGKSALAFSIMGLHDPKWSRVDGHIFFKNYDLANIPNENLNHLRGSDLGMIFQDPLAALNPLMIVGAQIDETLLLHTKMSKEQRTARVIELLDAVGIPNPSRVYSQYPHELSGGMRQRIVIATAIANNPSFLIADEPTTALDVTIQAQILELLKELKEKMDAGVMLITHDLGVVAEVADRVAVMYAGQIIEIAPVEELFANPKHPYTRSLLESVPSVSNKQERLHSIQGIVPPLQSLPRIGCRFKARIPWIPDEAHEENPILHEVNQGHFVRCTCYREFYFSNVKRGRI